MDLGTVKTRLLGNFYQSAEEMADAVHLTFSNAMTYNPPGSVAHEDARKCATLFEKKYEPVARKIAGNTGISSADGVPHPAPSAPPPPPPPAPLLPAEPAGMSSEEAAFLNAD